jgi:hypothetical protein
VRLLLLLMVIIGNAASIAGMVSAAGAQRRASSRRASSRCAPSRLPPAFQLQISSLNSQAAGFVSSGNCSAALQLEDPIKINTEFGFSALAVQSLGEGAALLSILVAFTASVILSARRFKQAQQSNVLGKIVTTRFRFQTSLLRRHGQPPPQAPQAADHGHLRRCARHIRHPRRIRVSEHVRPLLPSLSFCNILRHILPSLSFCNILRRYGLYFAIGEQLDGSSSGCVEPCSPCHSTPYVINRFLFFFPELRAAVVLLSSPITLLVACWGMTSPGNPIKSTRAHCLSPPRLQSPLTPSRTHACPQLRGTSSRAPARRSCTSRCCATAEP